MEITKEYLIEFWDILEAIKNEKTIQYSSINGWIDMGNTKNYDFGTKELYRIKPESKLIPFDYKDNLVGRTIVAKQKSHFKSIIVTQTDTEIRYSGNENYEIEYKYLLDHFIFIDGSPCGKYVEEE
jgi:hypothetical protein